MPWILPQKLEKFGKNIFYANNFWIKK